jgi:hypothetical protein
MKLNNPGGWCVGLMMRLVLISLTLALGAVQALPMADCLCGPRCDGRTPAAAPETRSCCHDEAPAQPQPCACFHRAPPDPATLQLHAPPAIVPFAAETPSLVPGDSIHFDILPVSNSWRADQARGSPLYLLHSALLI